MLDKNTRFLLTSLVTDGREIKDARKVFSKIKEFTNTKPEEIITYGLWSYEDAIRKEFLTWRVPHTIHIRLAGRRKKIDNNLVERLQETIREGDKILRGFKGNNSAQALLEGYRIYYNFIRNHITLNTTPAEVAGINLGLNGRNRWLELLNRTVNQNFDGLPVFKPKDWFDGIIRISQRLYKVKVFDENGIEIEDPKRELGLKTEFTSEEKAKEFIEFYKLFYPTFKFLIVNGNY